MYEWFHRKCSDPEERGEYSAGYWQDMVRQEAFALCRESNGNLLEIGCGEGFFLLKLARARCPGARLWGIDNNETRLKEAQNRCDNRGIKRVTLSLQDASKMSFENGFFDVVVCVNVFLNMDSAETLKSVLQEIKRVCKPSGAIIFDFRNAANPLLRLKYRLARHYDNTLEGLPLTAYHPGEVESILRSLNFKIVKRKFLGFPLKWLSPINIIEAKNNGI